MFLLLHPLYGTNVITQMLDKAEALKKNQKIILNQFEVLKNRVSLHSHFDGV